MKRVIEVCSLKELKLKRELIEFLKKKDKVELKRKNNIKV